MATISDVARQAGVSPATVSRVLQGAKNVQPATREKVEQAIRSLGYVPNAVAQSLRSKRTRSLALVVPDVTNTFWTTVARGVEDAAQAHDYSVLLCNTDENPSKQLFYLDVVLAQRVDGVIIAPYDTDAQNLAQLRDRGIPTVIIDRRIDGWEVDSVRSDSISGARALVQHLIALGHRQIAALSGSRETSTAEDRVTGYCLALAEAGLPVDPRLIKRGEFLTDSGEHMTDELLDEGQAPTAIFATNNAIALGAIDAVAKRGLRIPQDLALVCFDDLPNVSHIFPFLTVVAQPAYDMGLNAAQLLLSRLDQGDNLPPRLVLLPTRLIIRHSCGSHLGPGGDCPLSLPLPKSANDEQDILVRALTAEERRELAQRVASLGSTASRADNWLSDAARPDAGRLSRAIRYQEPDQVPHLELWPIGRSVYQYVFNREPNDELGPEEQVDLARRLGLDAIVCDLGWPIGPGPAGSGGSRSPFPMVAPPASPALLEAGDTLRSWLTLDDLKAAPSLAGQLSVLERYLRAAQGSGVGVVAGFEAFFRKGNLADLAAAALRDSHANRVYVERLVDIFFDYQEKVVRTVCDRFAADLALVVIHQPIQVLDPELFEELVVDRLRRLIAPAKEHGKLLALHGSGTLELLLPSLHKLGFDAVYLEGYETGDLARVKREWGGRLAFIGGIAIELLARGSRDEIEACVRDACATLAPSGGYVLAPSGSMRDGTPPANFVTMARAVRKYGRYGALGQDQVGTF